MNNVLLFVFFSCHPFSTFRWGIFFSFSLGTFRGFFLSDAIFSRWRCFPSTDDGNDGNDETMRREFYERNTNSREIKQWNRILSLENTFFLSSICLDFDFASLSSQFRDWCDIWATEPTFQLGLVLRGHGSVNCSLEWHHSSCRIWNQLWDDYCHLVHYFTLRKTRALTLFLDLPWSQGGETNW